MDKFIRIRIYPRLRHVFLNNWDKFVTISLDEMEHYLNHWWPMGHWKVEDGFITSDQIDQWFYERYMSNIDHTVFKEDRWRSGVF